MVAEMQVNLGLALHSIGEHEPALEQMNTALAVFTQMNDSNRRAQVLGNMARVYAKMGNSEQAMTNYREASAIFSETGRRRKLRPDRDGDCRSPVPQRPTDESRRHL